jgi:heme-degrading monooxygenase HmoA
VLARTPEPPYVAVIFSAVATADDEGYDDASREMRRLAALQPGYLGVETTGGGPGALEITVSYWATEDDARAWKAVAEHAQAQRLGQRQWYEAYEVRVATVGRSYGWAPQASVASGDDEAHAVGGEGLDRPGPLHG